MKQPNENALTERRGRAIEELMAALAGIESGEGLLRLVEGHGIQSRFFRFAWDEPALKIDFRLPYARVLSSDEAQAEDNKRIGAAIRLAALLLQSKREDNGFSVGCNENAYWYAVFDAEGNEIDSGNDWMDLVKHFESESQDPSKGTLTIIWP